MKKRKKKNGEQIPKKRQNIRAKISNWNEQSMDDIWFLFKRTFLLPLHGLPEKCEQKTKKKKKNYNNNNNSCKDTINALFFHCFWRILFATIFQIFFPFLCCSQHIFLCFVFSWLNDCSLYDERFFLFFFVQISHFFFLSKKDK